MAVENITTVPLPVTESSVAVVVKLLSFDEEQLLSLAKTHLVTGMFPQISITALKNDPSLSVSMGFSLVAFFENVRHGLQGNNLPNCCELQRKMAVTIFAKS